MKTAHVLGCLILAAIIIIPLALAFSGKIKPGSMRSIKRAFGCPAGQLSCNGLAGGLHPDAKLSLFSDGAHTARHLLVKRGSDANHMAVISGMTDEPLGVCFDQPPGAEYGAGVQLLGGCGGTVPVISSEAIAIESWLYSNGDGTVQNNPATAGTFWLVGKAKTPASAANQQIEMEPCTPLRVVILAALACTDGTAGGAADLTALKAECEKIGDDVRRIAAACDGRTLVQVLSA